jgi:hypothetical protein
MLKNEMKQTFNTLSCFREHFAKNYFDFLQTVWDTKGKGKIKKKIEN